MKHRIKDHKHYVPVGKNNLNEYEDTIENEESSEVIESLFGMMERLTERMELLESQLYN